MQEKIMFPSLVTLSDHLLLALRNAAPAALNIAGARQVWLQKVTDNYVLCTFDDSGNVVQISGSAGSENPYPLNSAPNMPYNGDLLAPLVGQMQVTIGDWTMTVYGFWVDNEGRGECAATVFYNSQHLASWTGESNPFIMWKNNAERVLVKRYQYWLAADGNPDFGTNGWILEGSDDGSVWTVIDIVSDQSRNTQANPAVRQLPNNVGAYYYHRIRVTQCNTGASFCGLKAWSTLL